MGEEMGEEKHNAYDIHFPGNNTNNNFIINMIVYSFNEHCPNCISESYDKVIF